MRTSGFRRSRRQLIGLALGTTMANVDMVAAADPRMVVKDIERMIASKIPEDVIVLSVRKGEKPLELNTDEIIRLKGIGASDNLIRMLLSPGADGIGSQPFKKAASPTREEAATTKPPQLEIGIYFRRNDEWTELQPEVVNFKQGGTIKSLATAGVVKKDLNGFLIGQHSRNSVSLPLQLLIVSMEGVGVTEYQLLRLREGKENREFRSVTGGIMNVQGGSMRDLVPFEGKKLASRQFEVLLPASLGAGEYGFLPPGTNGGGGVVGTPTGATGRMYTFRVVE